MYPNCELFPLSLRFGKKDDRNLRSFVICQIRSSHNELSVNFTAALATLLTSVLLLSWKKPRSTTHAGNPSQAEKTAIHALLQVLTPTCSAWPSFYVQACRNADKAQKRVVKLPLEKIVDDVVNGVVELRNPTEDLRALVRGNLRIGRWDVVFTPGLFTWMNALCWIITQEFSTGTDEVSFSPRYSGS